MTAAVAAPEFVGFEGEDPLFNIERDDQAPAVANPDAPYGTRADGTPKAKPGPPPGRRPAAKKAAPKKTPPRRPAVKKAVPKKAAPAAPFTMPAPEAKTTNVDSGDPAAKYAQFLAQFAGIPQGALLTVGMARNDVALQADAAVIGNLANAVAGPIGEVIAQNPNSRIAQYIDKAMTVSPWFAIAMPAVAAVAQVLHNHKILPPLMGAVPPRFLAAVMRRQAAETIGQMAGPGNVDYAAMERHADVAEAEEAFLRQDTQAQA